MVQGEFVCRPWAATVGGMAMGRRWDGDGWRLQIGILQRTRGESSDVHVCAATRLRGARPPRPPRPRTESWRFRSQALHWADESTSCGVAPNRAPRTVRDGPAPLLS
eukprot:6736959-Prymnesium_polylepis.1